MDLDTEITEENLNKKLHDKLRETTHVYKNFNLSENYFIYKIKEYNYNASYVIHPDDSIVRRNLKNYFVCLYEKVYLYTVVTIGYTSISHNGITHDCYFYIVKEYLSPNYHQLEPSSNFLFYSNSLYSVIEFLVDSHKKLILKGLTDESKDILDSIDFNNLTI